MLILFYFVTTDRLNVTENIEETIGREQIGIELIGIEKTIILDFIETERNDIRSN